MALVLKVNKQMLNKKMKVALLTIAIIVTGAVVLGCSSPTPTQSASPTPAATWLAGTIKVMGSTSVQPYADELAGAFMDQNKKAQVLVSGGGSSVGIKAAQDGTAAIGTSSRELTRQEKDAGLKETVIAYDGIVVIVHKDNPVAGLTMQQIKDIYAGNVTSWKDVGGVDAPITVVTRDLASGTRAAFQELVMGKANITDNAVQSGSTGNVIQTVAGNPRAIGYISLGTLDDTVKALKVDGIVPSAATVKDKTYKVQRPFLYITRGEVTDPVAKAFIEYTLCPEGQAILARHKLVTL